MMQSITSNKGSTSFHSIALNFTYISILTAFHFLVPYIHELVYSFFNGLFLILSIIAFFYFNAILRTSSITHFSYASLFFRIVLSISFLALTLIFIAFLTNTTEIIKRDQFISFIINVTFFSILAMALTKKLYGLIKPQLKTNIVLLTDLVTIQNSTIKNFLKDDNVTFTQFHTKNVPEMLDHIIDKGVEAVYVYIDSKNLNTLEPLIQELSIYAFNLYWVLPETLLNEGNNLISTRPVQLNSSPVYLDTNQYLLKRSLDVVGAVFILFAIFPIAVLVALFIKISDRGPILYTQLRYGQFGKEFRMFKFRSMIVNSDYSDQQVFDDDPRVTLIGKIIRKTSFDEVPQLLNVLRGEMSLVGPRPHIISETNLYSQKILRFLTRHHVKPGLTGLAQIRARGKTNTIELMQEKLKSDLEYINQWTFF